MSHEDLAKFLTLAAADDALAREVLEHDTTEGLIAIGARHGCSFTVEDVNALHNRELSDDELDAVAGGFNPMAALFVVYKDSITDDNQDPRWLHVNLGD